MQRRCWRSYAARIAISPIAIFAPAVLAGCAPATAAQKGLQEAEAMNQEQAEKDGLELATLGGGCFWCVEAVFEEVEGVKEAVSGYAGGRVENPNYQQVCSGLTGHAEVVQVAFDPTVISYAKILEIFFKTHDPTTLNRQGPDMGTQYRSVIFYHDAAQQKIAEELKAKLDESGAFRGRIVTEIAAAPKFYPAEAYHQDYWKQNPGQGYCRAVIGPKMSKFRQVFKDYLKD